MERSSISEHFDDATGMSIVQTSRGWLSECFGCEARTEFKWYQVNDGVRGTQFGSSLEDSSCCLRLCCDPCHPFQMTLRDITHDSALFAAERPCRLPSVPFKCCCYQEMSFTAPQQDLGIPGKTSRKIGSIRERCYCCVPRFMIFNGDNKALYKVHMPTCCCGICVNCCAEGNPCCGSGCCIVPFYIYPANQARTDGEAPVGKIIKAPKSVCAEIFTEANRFDVEFPPSATGTQKAVIAGSTIFLNALFFEEDIAKHN